METKYPSQKKKLAPQLCAAISATIIMTGVGFHFGWASPTLPKLLENTSIPVTIGQGTWIVSLLMIGSLLGPLFSLSIVDRWGRKNSMLLLSIPFFISCMLITFAQNYWMYYIARFIAGIGMGAVFTIVPMYLGEIAEDRIRGSFGLFLSIMSNIGYLIPYGAGPWLSTPVLAALGAVIPVVFVSIFAWMPETPYHYIRKNDAHSARKSLEWLRGTTDVDEEVEQVTRTVDFNLKNQGTWRDLFMDKGNRKALLIIIGIYSGQQITGIAAILAYTTIIFNEVSTGISSSVSVIITGVVQLVMAILVAFVADKRGRRTLLLISMFGSVIFLAGEGVYFHLKCIGNDVSAISWLPVTSIVGYLCSYTLGIGTLPLSIISEIFPCRVKALATTISTIYLALSAVCISQFYPLVSNAYGIYVAFYFFASGTALFMLFVYFYMPETRGKSLGEIQNILQGRSSKPGSELDVLPQIKTSSILSIATVNVPQGGKISY